MVSVVLVDLSGTLHIGNEAVPGAAAALAKLRSSLPEARVLFVTNTTKESRARMHKRLEGLGFDIALDEIFTALSAARRYVEERSLRPFLFLPDASLEDFDGVELLVDPASASDETLPKSCVVVGLAPEHFYYEKLNTAFRMIAKGAELVAINKEPYYATPGGHSLGPGSFVAALEYGANVEATLIGKPSKAFFESALSYLGYSGPRDAVVMVGDSIRGDALGATDAGLNGILVRTGKYRDGDERRFGGDNRRPTEVCADFPAAVEWILERSRAR